MHCRTHRPSSIYPWGKTLLFPMTYLLLLFSTRVCNTSAHKGCSHDLLVDDYMMGQYKYIKGGCIETQYKIYFDYGSILVVILFLLCYDYYSIILVYGLNYSYYITYIYISPHDYIFGSGGVWWVGGCTVLYYTGVHAKLYKTVIME